MYNVENKKNFDVQKLQDELEKQYGPAVAQDIIDRIKKNGNTAKSFRWTLLIFIPFMFKG